jgi:HAD superfamily hydrolase (TIGR01549 family)
MRDVLARLEHSFDIALSRTFQPCKPSPAPLNHIIKHCGEDATATIMVGDSIDDIQCGNGEQGDGVLRPPVPLWLCTKKTIGL